MLDSDASEDINFIWILAQHFNTRTWTNTLHPNFFPSSVCAQRQDFLPGWNLHGLGVQDLCHVRHCYGENDTLPVKDTPWGAMWCVNTGLGALQMRAEHWRKRTFKWIFRHFWSGFVWGTCAQRCRWAQLLHIISQNLGRTTEKHCCCFKELCVLQPLAFPPKYLAILCMLFPNSALISCLKLLHTVHFTVVPGKTLITTFWYNYFILGIGSQRHVIKLPSRTSSS